MQMNFSAQAATTFSGQGRAPALDHVQVSVHFVGTVDVERHRAHGVELEHLDAVAAQPLGAGLGAGHGAGEVVAQLGQAVDEEVGGGAGTDAEHGVAMQLGANLGDGGRGDGVLELVLG